MRHKDATEVPPDATAPPEQEAPGQSWNKKKCNPLFLQIHRTWQPGACENTNSGMIKSEIYLLADIRIFCWDTLFAFKTIQI